MDRFLSHYILPLDAKGRVSVPAAFRVLLAREGLEGFYCCPALDHPALEAGGKNFLAEIEQLIARFPHFSQEREHFATALYATSVSVKMDGEGRVTLSEALKDHVGIMQSAAFVGLGHKFQIWAPDRFSAQLSAATGKMRTFKKRRGVQSMPKDAHGARGR